MSVDAARMADRREAESQLNGRGSCAKRSELGNDEEGGALREAKPKRKGRESCALRSSLF
ncbi:MAG: hypothetical protein Pyrs2KO_34810 [Pyruvatibacter sp.]